MSRIGITLLGRALLICIGTLLVIVLGVAIYKPKYISSSRDLVKAWYELRLDTTSALANEQYAMTLSVFPRNVVGNSVVHYLKIAVELDPSNKRMIRNLAFESIFNNDFDMAVVSMKKYVQIITQRDFFDLSQAVVLIRIYLIKAKAKNLNQDKYTKAIRELRNDVENKLNLSINMNEDISVNIAELILQTYTAFGEWNKGDAFIQAKGVNWQQNPYWHVSVAQYYEDKGDVARAISTLHIANDIYAKTTGIEEEKALCVEKIKKLSEKLNN